MYKITLSPQFSDAKLTIIKAGSALTINANSYDFSSLNNGDEIPSEAINNDFLVGGIKKVDGIVHLAVIMPNNDAEAPEHIRFPEPIMLIEDTEIVFNEKVQADD